MTISPKIVVIIPIYNENQVIKEVVSGIQSAGYQHIIVVDDGSTDKSFDVAQQLPVTVLHHKINRGKGAALRTGLEAAKIMDADIVVTMDGDGQHDPSDIDKFIQPFLKDTVDVVLGIRNIEKDKMPIARKIANWIADKITFLLYGIHIHDSQSGFRAFSLHAVEKIRTKTDAYSYESEVLREIRKNHLRYLEVPIHVRYTQYSTSKKHKQNIVNGIKTLYTMIWNILT